MDTIRNILLLQGWAAGVIGLLLIAALLSAREQRTANRFLALTLLCGLFRELLVCWTLFLPNSLPPYLVRSTFPTELLALPLFSFYIRAFTTPNFRLVPGDLKHLIPALGGLVWYLLLLRFGDQSYFLEGESLERERYARVLVKLAIAAPYLLVARRSVKDFQYRAKRNSSNEIQYRARWLSLFIVAAISLIAVDFADAVTGPKIPMWHLVPAAFFFAVVALALFSLRYSAVFAEELESENREAETQGQPKQSPEEIERLKEKLLAIMSAEQLHLNPDLRLADLAAALKVKPYRVSEVLSQGLNTTFYEFINANRIKTAQEKMVDPKNAHLSLLGISLESGFKSKSVFNDTFKRVTGRTPSQFREEQKTC